MSDKPDNYDIESSAAGDAAESAHDEAIPKPRMAGIPRPAEVEPLSIEADDDVKPAVGRTVHDLDVCPNCGATMRGPSELVCIRCGFDLKTNKPVETKLGVEEIALPASAERDQTALSRSGNGDFWLPLAMLAISGLILLVAYFMGLHSLFPKIVAVTPEGQIPSISFLHRIEGLARTAVLIGMLTACGMGALVFLATLLGRRTADSIDGLKLAGVRMAAIIVTAQLATLLALRSPAWEWMLETVIQLLAFTGLSMALFRLKPRDAATLTGSTLIALLLLWLAAFAVIWAAAPK